MNYDEALEVTVTAQEAKREIEKHHASFTEFQAECGKRESYTGEQVLAWLGY